MNRYNLMVRLSVGVGGKWIWLELSGRGLVEMNLGFGGLDEGFG